MEIERRQAAQETRLLIPKSTYHQEAHHSEQRGYVFVAVGATFWSLLAFFVHIGETKYAFPAVASVFVRAIINCSLSALFILFLCDDSFKLPTKRQAVFLFARGVVGSLGCLFSFLAVKYLPIGTALTVFCTSPALTTILCAVFLGEFPSATDIFALVCSFAGVVLVAQPPVLFGTHAVAAAEEAQSAGVLYALLVALCGSAVFTLVRYMGLRVHFIFNVISPAICMGVLSVTLADQQVWTQLASNKAGLSLNLIGALCGFAGVSSVVRGLQLCRAGAAMIVRTVDVPLSFVLGYLFLGESLRWWTALGVSLILLSTLLIARQKLGR